jgi:hypothetical protein
VSNDFGSSTWAAACPPASELSPRVLAPLSVLGSAYLEAGRDRLSGRPGGVKTQVEKHVSAAFAAAARVAAQVKDTGIRMPLGPPPWSPPERKL